MPASGAQTRGGSTRQLTAAGAVAAYALYQLADGQAGVAASSAGAAAGDRGAFTTAGQFPFPKVAGAALLDGGRAYWDRANGWMTWKHPGGRGFYAGRFVGDAASGDATCTVNLNADPRYDRELGRGPFRSVLVGTQAAGGFGGPYPRGGAVKVLLDATNEAQKVDALGKLSFGVDAKAVVELAVEVVSVGSGGAPDLNVGIASGTHATDADAIANHLFLHVDGNSLTAKVQSADGTHTVAATTTGTALVAGVRSEIWFDMRVPSAVKVYQDGVLVLGSTAIDVSAAPNPLFLLAHLEKTVAADAFEADVDWLRARFMEQKG